MHPFDWGTLTWGPLPVGFYTLILFIIKWHNVRLPFRPSVSACHAVHLVLFVVIYKMWISNSVYISGLIAVEIKPKLRFMATRNKCFRFV